MPLYSLYRRKHLSARYQVNTDLHADRLIYQLLLTPLNRTRKEGRDGISTVFVFIPSMNNERLRELSFFRLGLSSVNYWEGCRDARSRPYSKGALLVFFWGTNLPQEWKQWSRLCSDWVIHLPGNIQNRPSHEQPDVILKPVLNKTCTR